VVVHFLVDAGELVAGARVEPVFVAKSRRTGSILDVRGFRPVAG
jgi:uncharacterized OB-fold protein